MIVLVTTPLLGRRGITIIKLHGCLLPSRMASGARFASGRQGRPDRTAGRRYQVVTQIERIECRVSEQPEDFCVALAAS